ncbi:MAG: class I SAM-dependent methyltransferase [Deltaproteobacteria bacterium]
MAGALENRLRKRAQHLARWAAREGTDAYRIFDRDIPGYHFAIDRYANLAAVHEYPWKAGDPLHLARRAELLAALPSVLGLHAERLVSKVHERRRPGDPSPARAGQSRKTVVHEHGLAFELDLGAHLDAGLFLDHRSTRALVRSLARGRRVLNLFAYTGAFTVHAAAGGASGSVSVDLSRSYLDWARRNLEQNRLASPKHALVVADAFAFLEGDEAPFDLIVLDPPPRSASKRGKSFELQRDQGRLLTAALGRLAKGGILLFSSNFGPFQLDPAPLAGFTARELTPGSLPEDFKGKRPHRLWRIERR